MKRFIPMFFIAFLLGCNGGIPPIVTPPKPPVIIPPEPPVESYVDKCGKLVIEERFIKCSKTNEVFRWRGITWFRFIHQVANNEDVSYLDELGKMEFNLLRTLSTAFILFDLTPTDGLNNLDEALKLARSKSFYVEIVAVIDTEARPYDWKNHARKVAEICAANDNCVLEYANEPGHSVQAEELHDLIKLTNTCNETFTGLDLLFSCGSWGTDEPICIPSDSDCQSTETPHPIGLYLTPHLDRGRDKWNMVRRVRSLEDLSNVFGGPTVNDEPIGFAEVEQSGRRLIDCDIALTFGVLSRIMEVGTTFHLEAGLRDDVLGGIQSQCAKDFITGSKILDDNVVLSFKNAGWSDSPVKEANFDDDDGCCVVRVYSGISGDNGITIALGITGDPQIVMQNGWSLNDLLIDRPAVKVWRISK